MNKLHVLFPTTFMLGNPILAHRSPRFFHFLVLVPPMFQFAQFLLTTCEVLQSIILLYYPMTSKSFQCIFYFAYFFQIDSILVIFYNFLFCPEIPMCLFLVVSFSFETVCIYNSHFNVLVFYSKLSATSGSCMH